MLKFIHGYGSTGQGGKLRLAVRAELRAIHAGRVVPGESWSIFDEDSRALLERFPSLRADSDLERGNAGITLVEVSRTGPA